MSLENKTMMHLGLPEPNLDLIGYADLPEELREVYIHEDRASANENYTSFMKINLPLFIK
jgi:hypothetical protein